VNLRLNTEAEIGRLDSEWLISSITRDLDIVGPSALPDFERFCSLGLPVGTPTQSFRGGDTQNTDPTERV